MTGSGRENLVRAASQHDPDAVATLLQRHLPALCAFVRLKAGPSLLAKESCAGAREELQRVEAAFAKLAPEKQEVVLMARLMGLSHAQIAQETGKTEVAVRSILSRALAELSAHL